MDGMQMSSYGYGESGSRPVSLESRVAKRLGVGVGILMASFGLTLAVVVGQRLSDQAMAVLAGAVCGVVASIPPSLLIIWVTRRKSEVRMPVAGAYPPVVVVQPPVAGVPGVRGEGISYLLPPAAPMDAVPVRREFVVVGEE